MTRESGGNDGESKHDCTDGCGSSYGDPEAARLCCDQRAQAAILARRWADAETGRRGAPGVTRTGPGATDVYPPEARR